MGRGVKLGSSRALAGDHQASGVYLHLGFHVITEDRFEGRTCLKTETTGPAETHIPALSFAWLLQGGLI